jgi:hypothetical protein
MNSLAKFLTDHRSGLSAGQLGCPGDKAEPDRQRRHHDDDDDHYSGRGSSHGYPLPALAV